MFRRALVGLGGFSMSGFVANCNSAYPFDTKGFATNTGDLKLSGVGMRRKNFYIVDVDVYLTALNLSSKSLTVGKNCMKKGANECQLADDLFECIQKTPKSANAEATITLKFVRNVTKSQVVEAFNEAFAGLNPDEVNQFKANLSYNVREDGMKVGEEIVFTWQAGGGLMITRSQGESGQVYRSDGIEKRLLEVYVDTKRAVSPDLMKSIQENILKI